MTGTLALDGNEHRLLLRGDRVLVIANKGASPTTSPSTGPWRPTVAQLESTTIVTEINVSAAPVVMRTMEVPGRFVDARQNGAVARLVIDSVPQPIAEAAGSEPEPLHGQDRAQEQPHGPDLPPQPRAV